MRSLARKKCPSSDFIPYPGFFHQLLIIIEKACNPYSSIEEMTAFMVMINERFENVYLYPLSSNHSTNFKRLTRLTYSRSGRFQLMLRSKPIRSITTCFNASIPERPIALNANCKLWRVLFSSSA